MKRWILRTLVTLLAALVVAATLFIHLPWFLSHFIKDIAPPDVSDIRLEPPVVPREENAYYHFLEAATNI